MRFQGVRASAQSAKRAARADGAEMYGLHFGCWVLARALRERRLLELGLVLPEDGRYREPMGVGVETYGLAAGQGNQNAIR